MMGRERGLDGGGDGRVVTRLEEGEGGRVGMG